MKLFSGKCVSKARLDGKTAIITGANCGIGKITAKEFYRIGARVVMACRDIQKAEEAAQEIQKTVTSANDSEPVGQIVIKKLDLSSFTSIKQCAKDILQSEQQINLLINNAGIMMCPQSKTEDGFEMQFGVNHLGHFLLTCLLLPRILQSTPARIVNVSSLAHERGRMHFDDLNMEKNYAPFQAYAQSKLANILFTKQLADRLKNTGVNVYAVHPGLVKTEIGRHFGDTIFPGFRSLIKIALFFRLKTPEQGAQTSIYCSIDEQLADESGLYYSDCKKTTPSGKATNSEDAATLWEKSVKMVGLGDWNPFNASPNTPPLLENI